MSHELSKPLASLIGAGWVLLYVVTTSFGSRYYSSGLWRYVVGAEYNLGAEMATEALFVITARFLIAFGFSWAILSIIASRKGKRQDVASE